MHIYTSYQRTEIRSAFFKNSFVIYNHHHHHHYQVSISVLLMLINFLIDLRSLYIQNLIVHFFFFHKDMVNFF